MLAGEEQTWNFAYHVANAHEYLRQKKCARGHLDECTAELMGADAGSFSRFLYVVRVVLQDVESEKWAGNSAQDLSSQQSQDSLFV